MRIEYLPRARRNLADLRAFYVDAGGKDLARRMVSTVREEVAQLAENPMQAPAYDLVKGIRRLVVAKGAWLVFYQVARERVEVLHVRRAERDEAEF